MGKIQARKNLALFFVLHYSLVQLVSSAYVLPEKYFIDCGSSTNVAVDTRNFTGDSNPSSFNVSANPDISEKLVNPSSGLSPLYQIVRVFTRPSSYEFNIDDTGMHMVRLHFFPSSYPNYDTAMAVFNVSAAPVFSLFMNFSVLNSANTPVLKEYLLSIKSGKFSILFTPLPSHGKAFAFVNAIEVFPVPVDFISDEVQFHISPSGSNGVYQGLQSQVLETVHRINVGGLKITPENDSLWRNWIPDDMYLYIPAAARNKSNSTILHYQGRATEYIAPAHVYMTAKEMNMNASSGSQVNNFNITWRFNVSKNVSHLVRVHFCDIVSTDLHTLDFRLFINKHFMQKIDLSQATQQLAAPYYIDYVVDSDDSGLMWVSVGPDLKDQNAILNGLEIMEVMNNRSGSSSSLSCNPKKKNIPLLVGSVLGSAVFMGILIFAVLGLKQRRKPKPNEITTWLPLYECGGSSSNRLYEGTTNGSPVPNLGLKIPFNYIQIATNNFDPNLLIGSGGFGKVYKGVLGSRNMKVAVKRSEPGGGQGLLEFQTEITVLSKIRHRHLVSLIGYCDEQGEMILVYEFMERGTLRSHLYDSNLPSLSWKQRLEICIGSAIGLHYLHTGAEGRIIHRDVKSTNILLDENYVAKVADFGLSKPGQSLDQSHVSTGVKGSFGYVDPEYFKSEQLTEKSDVYSFGVVLLEVLCARPAINRLLPRDQVNLAQWAMQRHKKGLLEHIIDPLLVGKINPSSVKKFVGTVETCLSECGADRPTMGDVLWDLEYALKLQETGGVQREPHEDSTISGVPKLPMPRVQCVPSLIDAIDTEDEVLTMMSESVSKLSESQVFSQLMINDGR
ncbi:probable receptor-like protein kinase At5g24010 [Macadamia integrifolia]|uniref:probable receptor-like protein kinase At5g24010 n=1 Tax=Macadamia integrifolia TaxID=60698 RepID=UPI001C4F77D4|nr:probable receptor-like protein kinase At5g24010 [Macadamia integrifolia]